MRLLLRLMPARILQRVTVATPCLLLTLALAPVGTGLLTRLFIIQHDCGHGSFFRSKTACDLVGGAIGVLTLTPYEYWKREHAIHHATSGLLDKRGHGDIDTLTVEEYRNLSAFARLRYRLYRHPLVLFGVGPAFQFLVLQRLPLNAPPTFSLVGTPLGVRAGGASSPRTWESPPSFPR